MRVITLLIVIVVVFFFAKDAHGRTIMLDEEQVEILMSEEQFNINGIENLRKGK